MALRVNEPGLSFLVEQIKPMVPDTLEVPAITKVVVDWPMTEDDATVQTQPMVVALNLKDLQLTMNGDALRLVAQADVSTDGPVTVFNPYASFGQADCHANIQVQDLVVDLSMRVSIQGTKVAAVVTNAHITLDNDNSIIALEDCFVGDVITTILDFLRTYFMDTIQSKLEEIAKEQVPALMASKLSETISISREVQGFAFTGRLDSLATDEAGVTARLGVGIELSQPVLAPCLAGVSLGEPPACAGYQHLLDPQHDAMFGVGLSQAILNHGLHAVWRSGKLCLSSQTLQSPALSQGMSQLAVQLGQPRGTDLAFSIQMGEAPRIQLTTDSGVRLILNKVAIRLSMSPPGGQQNEININADLAVAATPWIDPQGNTVTLDLHAVHIGRLSLLDLDGQASTLQLDPARLERFINTVAMPVLQEKLSATPLTPSVINAMSYMVELKGVDIRNNHIAAHINAYNPKKTGETTPPQTLLVDRPGPVVGPQVIRILVNGTDNQTPAALLRYRARVDGTSWTGDSYGGRIDITVHGGAHVVEIAAVDLEGNVDPTPVAMHFKVDDVLPQLAITSKPESYLADSNSAVVHFDARDDRTPPEKLAFTVQLYRSSDGGGQPEMVAAQTPTPGARSARFDDLVDGVYRIRVVVQDEVGNVTSQDVGFVVNTAAGCSVVFRTDSTSGSGAVVVLLLFALFALVRRRRSS